jgi:hypothetical protein
MRRNTNYNRSGPGGRLVEEKARGENVARATGSLNERTGRTKRKKRSILEK